MRRKEWQKRRQPQYKLDRRETIMRWTIIVVVCVVVAFMLSGLVYAQPELKVGQEVELKRNSWAGCEGRIVKITDTSIVVVEKVNDPVRPERKWEYCVQPFQTITSYRILRPTLDLKPAPRPEFKLPSMKDYEGCLKLQNEGAVSGICPGPYKDHRDIADELRYLREEIKGLKK